MDAPPHAFMARWSTLKRALPGVTAVAGALATVMLLHSAGWQATVAALRTVAPAVPAVAALEILRLTAEVLATRALYGRQAAAIPVRALVRAHLAGYVACTVMPAGRAAAETAKATLLAPWVGASRAVGVAALSQSLSLIAVGLSALPCCAAAMGSPGASTLAGALALQAVFTVTLGTLLAVAVRHPTRVHWLRKRLPRVADRIASIPVAVQTLPALPRQALGWFLVERWIPVAQYCLMLAAVASGGVLRALVCQGAALVGGTLGDLVPAQAGMTEGALALVAPVLQVPAATALGLAAALHGVQLVCALGAAATVLATRSTRPTAPSALVELAG